MSHHTLFILGGAGFIGHETVTEAVKAGWQVKAVVRSEKKAEALRQIGAQPVLGDVTQPQEWTNEVRGASALIDLVQPKLPRRLTRAAVQAISTERQAITSKIIAALHGLPVEERPVLFSISGADDLQPDAQKRISHRSPLREKAYGFGYIGLPVRKLLEQSGLDATYIYLGNIVYGPGKVFADQYVRALAKGAAFVIGQGTNHLPLSHVTDVARALVHLAGLPRTALVQQTFLVMDGSDTTQRQLLDDTAALMGVKPAKTIPSWLGALVAGHIAVDTVTLDVLADPSALLATGFRFTYPSHREGVPTTLAHMGYLSKGETMSSQIPPHDHFFVLLLTYISPLEAVDRSLEAHRHYLDARYASGHFLLSGRKEPRTGGVILARATSQEALQSIIAEDPYVQEGIAVYEVIEFVPSKAIPELAQVIA